MIKFKIHHRTTYRYRQLVSLGPHRLMLHPRESHDLRLMSSDVTITPAATVSWAQDVFGNAVAMSHFQAMADNLVIDSVAHRAGGDEHRTCRRGFASKILINSTILNTLAPTARFRPQSDLAD